MVPPTGSNMTYDRAIDSRWGDGMRSKHEGDRGSQSQFSWLKFLQVLNISYDTEQGDREFVIL